jgi:hypothetical protein
METISSARIHDITHQNMVIFILKIARKPMFKEHSQTLKFDTAECSLTVLKFAYSNK